MKKSQYELSVQINGKSVKEYAKDGRVFVEAKSGSSYSLKIKNNSWGRILAVFSVDGIDVITGNSAVDADSGYVISGYNNLEIKGFRVDSDKEASFKFFDKGNGKGYAEIKGDASAAGVIGVRIYAEKVKPVEPLVIKEYVPVYVDRPVPVYPPRPYWYDMTYTTSATSDSFSLGDTSATYGSNIRCDLNSVDLSSVKAGSGASANASKGSSRGGGQSANVLRSHNPSLNFCSHKLSAQSVEDEKPKGLDMTTGWGDAVDSKVTTVTFDRGELVCEMEIFYASRESLTQMGIKFDSIPEVAFPSAFSKKLNFCSPPPGWKG